MKVSTLDLWWKKKGSTRGPRYLHVRCFSGGGSWTCSMNPRFGLKIITCIMVGCQTVPHPFWTFKAKLITLKANSFFSQTRCKACWFCTFNDNNNNNNSFQTYNVILLSLLIQFWIISQAICKIVYRQWDTYKY